MADEQQGTDTGAGAGAAYEIDGVKITPVGGGYYDLEHPSLGGNIVRERGKESADQRAVAIAAAAKPPEGSMEPQPDLATALTGAEFEPAPAPSDQSHEIASLKEQVAAMTEGMAKMMELLQNPRTVTTDGGAPEPVAGQVPAGLSRHYRGEMDPVSKDLLAKAGFGTTKIVLEESESIPPTGLFVGHNGNAYMIAPGEPVEVPDFIISVLDDAVMSAPIVDPSSQKVLGYRDRSKYPYRRVS